MAVEGATTSRVFETYVERLLAPALRPGQVVVIDNLGAHRPKRVRELIEDSRTVCTRQRWLVRSQHRSLSKNGILQAKRRLTYASVRLLTESCAATQRDSCHLYPPSHTTLGTLASIGLS
jgi:hypothetical protein